MFTKKKYCVLHKCSVSYNVYKDIIITIKWTKIWLGAHIGVKESQYLITLDRRHVFFNTFKNPRSTVKEFSNEKPA